MNSTTDPRCAVLTVRQIIKDRGNVVENLKSEIAAIISEVAEIPAERIDENTPMAELGVDSLDALRIIAAIEKKYQIEVPEEHMGSVQTVSDIIGLVAASV